MVYFLIIFGVFCNAYLFCRFINAFSSVFFFWIYYSPCVQHGMLQCRFNKQNKIVAAEMMFDVMGFMQQLQVREKNNLIGRIEWDKAKSKYRRKLLSRSHPCILSHNLSLSHTNIHILSLPSTLTYSLWHPNPLSLSLSHSLSLSLTHSELVRSVLRTVLSLILLIWLYNQAER